MFKSIDIRFEDFKRLVLLMESPDDSVADVVNRLINEAALKQHNETIDDRVSSVSDYDKPGLTIKGVNFPNGTLFQARYKGKIYQHQVRSGKWTDSAGNVYDSPSSAAKAITGNNVNGWRFWKARLPDIDDFRPLEMCQW